MWLLVNPLIGYSEGWFDGLIFYWLWVNIGLTFDRMTYIIISNMLHNILREPSQVVNLLNTKDEMTN